MKLANINAMMQKYLPTSRVMEMTVFKSPEGEMQESEYIVYIISDPETRAPVYVGQTNDLKRRESLHRSIARGVSAHRNSPIYVWLREQWSKGAEIKLTPVISAPTRKAAMAAESALMHSLRKYGFNLLNVQDYAGDWKWLLDLPVVRN